MLTSLHISHYALIEHLELELQDGFTVITGETGAGKSILLGALGLLTGRRADTRVISEGQKKCVVEGVFNVGRLGLDSFFAENDIDIAEGECIVRREVGQSGRSRSFINDTPVQLSVLKQLSDYLFDIHSQHQNLLLGREDFLVDMLDGVAANEALRTAYGKTFSDYWAAAKKLDDLKRKSSKSAEEADFLRYQLQRIDEAGLKADEQTLLEAEQQQLEHAEEIREALYAAVSLGEEEAGDLPGRIRHAADALERMSEVSTAAAQLGSRLESVRIELEDIISEADDALSETEADPMRLQAVNDRLDTIYTLEQKHRADSVEELLRLADDMRRQLSAIDGSDEAIAELEAEVKRLETEVGSLAAKLTATRRKTAQTVAGKLLEIVGQLGMPHASLSFELQPKRPAADGADSVTFLFSANRNIKARNVADIASGGETARLMLALKSVMARGKSLPTIIFDEIDTGVSGMMAERMAQVMQEMSRHCQVVCITHLPQIAAYGKQHFSVKKSEDAGVTRSRVESLATDERLREIAGMLSGEQLTDEALGNARALLKQAQAQ